MSRFASILLAAMLASVPIASAEVRVETPAASPPGSIKGAQVAQPDAPAGARSDPQEAERRGLTSPEVAKTLAPESTDQGTRPPNHHVEDGPDLYNLISRVRSAPPGLDGKPIPRPNKLGSEPAKEMEPAQPEDMFLFPENYVE